MQYIVAYIAIMDLNALEIFIDVVNKGSFVEVAKARGVAPSSISRAIAGLEEELQIRLFHRTTRKISLTEAGQDYFIKIEPLLMELRQAGESAHDAKLKPKGKIRLTSSVAFGQHKIVPLLREFMESHPGVDVEYILSDRVIDIVGERIDIAVRHGALDDSSFIAQKLLGVRYLIVASRCYIERCGDLSSPEELAERDALLFDLPHFRNKWLFRKGGGAHYAVQVKGRCVISNALALRDMALHGAGLSLLPDWLVGEDVKAGRLVHVFPEYQVGAGDFDSSIWLVTPTRSFVPHKTQALLSYLKARI